MISRPDDNEIKKLKWLLAELRKAEEFCRPYFTKAQRNYELYRFSTSTSKEDWPYVNRVRSRDILAFVEDTTALMIQTLFATYPFFSVIPREETYFQQLMGLDPIKIGKQLEKVLSTQISHEDTEFFEEMVDYFKGGAIFGNSYVGIYPKFETDGSYQRPQIQTTDFWDVLPIPGGRRLSRCRGLFVRQWMTANEINEMVNRGIFRNVGELKPTASNGVEQKWHTDLLAEVGIENYNPDSNEIEVLHYFSGGHVITFANRARILRDSTEETLQQGVLEKPYPFDLPIVQYKYMPVPMEFFGMGIPEVLEVLQEDKNLIRSARRDNIDLVINKIILARQGADINYDALKYYAGAVWPVENIAQDIAPFEVGDVTQSSYKEEEVVRFDMENALSFFGYARGMTPTHSEQPNTVIKLQQAALNRQDLSIKMAEYTTLQNIAARVILLTRRYMSQQDYEAIIGEPDAGFYRLTEEQIRRFYVVKPVGSSVTNIKEVRQRQMEYAFAMLQGIAPISANPQMNKTPFVIDWFELAKTGLDFADIKNADRIITPVDPNTMMGQMGMGGMPGGMQMPGMPPMTGQEPQGEPSPVPYGG